MFVCTCSTKPLGPSVSSFFFLWGYTVQCVVLSHVGATVLSILGSSSVFSNTEVSHPMYRILKQLGINNALERFWALLSHTCMLKMGIRPVCF